LRRAALLLMFCIMFAGALMTRAEIRLGDAETKAAFQITDRNHDGRIDRAEFQRRMADIFYLRDTDKDGFLTMAELEGVTPRVFKAADRDGDGKLSFYEYINSRFQDFRTADRNNDGILSPEEVEGR
jgi:hypothetical protein